MIDLHSHVLPGIDDGAPDMATSVAMAQLAVADGVSVMACTPHFYPPMFSNSKREVFEQVSALQEVLDQRQIGLTLVVGGDVHVQPDLVEKLKDDLVPTINNSRYFLLEMDSTVLPPNFVRFCAGVVRAGFRPVLTHPERTSWLSRHYESIRDARQVGLLVQVTAGAILGDFGRRALAWSDRLLTDGLVDLVASDAHNIQSRPPGLSRVRQLIKEKFGETVATQLVVGTPSLMLQDEDIPLLDRTAKQLRTGSIFKRWIETVKQSR